MSSLAKILTVGIIWLIYTFLYFGLTVNTNSERKLNTNTGVTDTVGNIVNTFPVSFLWSNDTAYTTAAFTPFQDSLLIGRDTKDVLVITGLYEESERNSTDQPNLGFARAQQIASLFSGKLPDKQIRIRARTMPMEETSKSGYYEAANFSWTTAENKKEETVVQMKDRIVIRFPYGSDQRLADKTVDEYMQKLAERIKESNEKIQLTGHTDNSASAEFNRELGMRRALAIKDLLTRLGVPAEQIKTSSRGETQPVDSNETEEGRYNNRRVELRIQ